MQQDQLRDGFSALPDQGMAPLSGEHALRLASVSKAYEQGIPIIRDFSAEVPLGQAVAITGASGSGKSTLLHLMAGLVRPDSGSVCVLGRLCASQRDWDRARRQAIGYVFQESFLLSSLSVLDNLIMPMIGVEASVTRQRERATELLSRLGLAGKANAAVTKLSGGERQRVAIARAVVNRPRLIIADEPTGNLDFENTQLVTGLLHDLRREEGATLIIATHDSGVAATCGRHFAFRGGVVEDRSAAL